MKIKTITAYSIANLEIGINTWLANNPHVQIHTVSQSQDSGGSFNQWNITVVIWYEEIAPIYGKKEIIYNLIRIHFVIDYYLILQFKNPLPIWSFCL